jgi:hypothetical protein
VHGLIAESPGGAWSTGGAVLTFVFPMLLFIVVAGALYILYTKPEAAPGHRSAERPISYTSIPGEPTTGQSVMSEADRSQMSAGPYRTDDRTGTAESENAAPEGVE